MGLQDPPAAADLLAAKQHYCADEDNITYFKDN